MILADTDTILTIIQIPKQIKKQELLKLMPLEWLSNYKQFHQNSEPWSICKVFCLSKKICGGVFGNDLSSWLKKCIFCHLCTWSWDMVFYRLRQKAVYFHSLKKSFCSYNLSRHNIVNWKIFQEKCWLSRLSPYHLYKQKTSFTRSIKTLISTKRPLPKEYIQSSRLNQCALQAAQSEKYVTLEILTDLVTNWKREGYTHLHLGGVKLILTLHGRKCLLVTAKIVLLGTVLTTLHAGSSFMHQSVILLDISSLSPYIAGNDE